jgi:pimeloyl-ACP methyl ester carboxylesterase
MTNTIFDGITQHTVQTARLRASVLERPAVDAQRTVVFIHGNVSSSLFWQPTMLALPDDIRALAVDLRGFGDSETLPVDAARGLGDFAADVASVLDELGIRSCHVVGWSMGAGVAMQLMMGRPELFATLTLVAPVSPYGFGGSTGPDARMLTSDGAGTGGGGANQDFIARLAAHDTTADGQTSPRVVYRTTYVKNAGGLPHEDVWVESMLSTKTGVGNYPGDSTPSENWPGFAPGRNGVLNTMSPVYFNVSGIADLATKAPILWIHGADDVIVSDTSFYDLNYLGQLGAIPGWPGEAAAPPQPMKAQTRAVLDRYRANGEEYREVELADCGHSPHLEYPEIFARELLAHLA